ncbi:hypothetical protein [Staphylococcus phage Baghdad]|nr:hypothetical protein [Staphylococcus phage Baghdad]
MAWATASLITRAMILCAVLITKNPIPKKVANTNGSIVA